MCLEDQILEINKVQKLKYLGVGLNNKGARAHDKAKEAEATQSRFKLRTTRAKLGEGVAAEQLRSHITGTSFLCTRAQCARGKNYYKTVTLFPYSKSIGAFNVGIAIGFFSIRLAG